MSLLLWTQGLSRGLLVFIFWKQIGETTGELIGETPFDDVSNDVVCLIMQIGFY